MVAVPGSSAGEQLRIIRCNLGLSMRDVLEASRIIAARRSSKRFLVPPGRLSVIESHRVVPSIYRMYSLAAIYHEDVHALFLLYGVELDNIAKDLDVSRPPMSHLLHSVQSVVAVRMPVKVDPSFDLRRTTNLGRMVQQWGIVPMAYLGQLASPDFTYGYIGSEDFTMHPLLPPGSLIQVDESQTEVLSGNWPSLLQRPIYFVETREGYACCWCAKAGDQLQLQHHNQSSMPFRQYKHPQEAEVIGRVVGVAMRLDIHSGPPPVPLAGQPPPELPSNGR